MNAKKVRSSSKAAQEAAAKELQSQIDDILGGHTPPEPPRNLRDFINEKTIKIKPSRPAAKSSVLKKKK
jgi:hypothetical protein